MTDEYALEQLLQHEPEWQEHPKGGFIATRNGITLHITGSTESFTTLTISENFKRTAIYEPRSPLWKKPSTVKILLNSLLAQAEKQNAENHTEEYQEQLRNELLGKLVGWNC